MTLSSLSFSAMGSIGKKGPEKGVEVITGRYMIGKIRVKLNCFCSLCEDVVELESIER